MRTRGFTLLEVIVALGVFAVGATAAFAVLVAAAASGRRAEHEVHAALIAETVLADLRGDLGPDLDLTDFPLAAPAGVAAGPAGVAGPAPAPPPAPVTPPPPQGGGVAFVGPDGAPPPGPNPETRYLVRDESWPDYPDYRYDVAITPIEGPIQDEPWQFLVEVEVRWSDRGARRSATYSTIMLRGVGHLDNPTPSPPRR